MHQAGRIQAPPDVHDLLSSRPAAKSDVRPRIVVCICDVMLAIEVPGSSSPSLCESRTGRSTCNGLDFAATEFQDTILEFSDAHL